MSVTVDQIKSLLADQSNNILSSMENKLFDLLADKLAKKLAVSATSSNSAPVKVKRTRKSTGPSTNPWILFTKRVESLIRQMESDNGVAKEQKMLTVRVKQFASDLKTQKGYDNWQDTDILAALKDWQAPSVSKQELAGKTKRSASVSSAPETTTVQETEIKEEKGEKKEKKERKKKDKTEAAAPAEEPKPEKTEKKIKKPKAAPSEKPAVVDLSFYRWVAPDGTEYYKNDRGDLVSLDYDWAGRFNGKIVETVPEPDDLSDPTFRD